jgi:hypothetical protein
MTINIQKCSNVTVNGTHFTKNSKPVYNITTGRFYASGLDLAKELGVDPSSVSGVLTGKCKTCKGMRLCFMSEIMEHLEEINEQNRRREEYDRINAEKIAAYDAIIAEQAAKKEAQEKLAKQKAKCEELRKKLEAEVQLLAEVEALAGSEVA